MTEPLATSLDVVERLGRALTSEEAAKVGALILDASSSVIAYAGQAFTLHETTGLLRIRNREVVLPQRPVSAVTSIVDQFGNTLPFIWIEGDTTVTLASSTWLNAFELNILPWTRIAKVNVTYTHGYYAIPDDVVGVVCQIVGRALGTPSTDAGLTSETIAGYAYTQGAAAGAGPFGMLPDEKRILDRYRTLVGPALML